MNIITIVNLVYEHQAASKRNLPKDCGRRDH